MSLARKAKCLVGVHVLSLLHSICKVAVVDASCSCSTADPVKSFDIYIKNSFSSTSGLYSYQVAGDNAHLYFYGFQPQFCDECQEQTTIYGYEYMWITGPSTTWPQGTAQKFTFKPTSSSESWASIVFQPSTDYCEATGLNFIVVSMNYDETNGLQLLANFFQGKYNEAQVQDFEDNYPSITQTCEFLNIEDTSAFQTTMYYSTQYCPSQEEGTNFFICPFGNFAYNWCPPDKMNFEDESVDVSYTYEVTGIDTTSQTDPTGSRWTMPVVINLYELKYQNYFVGWSLVAIGGGQKISFSTSWKQGTTSSSTISNSFSEGFSASNTVGFKAFGVSDSESFGLSSSATQSFSRSLSESLSISKSKTATCNTNTCNGVLYQWTIKGTSGAQTDTVSDCKFACVPYHVNKTPQCPIGYCVDFGCQCCNSIEWSNDPTDPYVAGLLVSGGCKPGCTAGGSPCDEDADCCSGRCDTFSVPGKKKQNTPIVYYGTCAN